MSLLLLAVLMAGSNQCALEGDARAALRAWRENNPPSALAERRKAMDELAAKYPAAYEIQAQRISFYRNNLREEFPAVREAYVKGATENPKDSVALTLAAAALYRSDTPRAIELLKQALETSPDFPWAGLKLAEIYMGGKFEDKDKARASFKLYAEACGDRPASAADWVTGKVADTPTLAMIARRLRARLESEAAPEASDYEKLWSLEFRSRPPAEHPELRKQVAKDVARLIALKPDKRSLESVLAGVKQSGASKEELAAFEDRVLKEAPESYAAYGITYERWKKEHKEPEDMKDTTAWDVWKKAEREGMKQWVPQFTEVTWLEDNYTDSLISAGEMGDKDAVAAAEKYVQKQVLLNGPGMWTYANAASTLLEKGWAPAKAYEWIAKAWPLAEQEDRQSLMDDTLTDEKRKEISGGLGDRGYVASDYLKAMKLSGKQDVPETLRAYLEGPMPEKKNAWSTRYRGMAWLASVEGHDADALAYFQQALFTREQAPGYWRGKLEDTLLDDAKAAYLKTGGTEKAFALWSKPVGKPQELAEGRWEKPTKALPAFELSDLSGKTWKLKQLEGKALLINLWATWCGPCKAELPHFQKLYEQTKERADVQVISFNMDEDLGLVEPFLKDKGYTFPAIAAYTFVRGLFDGYGIPQNWLVDPKGKWIATQLGFDASEADWEGSMLKRLEAAKQGKPPAGLE